MAHITLTPPAAFADMAEDISRTIDYDALSRHLMALAQAEPTILLETLCRRLADACVQDFGAASATVELHKFILPFTQSVYVRCTV